MYFFNIFTKSYLAQFITNVYTSFIELKFKKLQYR